MSKSTLSSAEILNQIGGAESTVRLYPVRLAALSRLSDLKMEELIQNIILGPLAEISPPDSWRGPFRFDREHFGQEKVIVPTDRTAHATQWVSDFGVYGMQEAVAYLADVPYTSDPSAFLNTVITWCYYIRKVYGHSQLLLMRSEDAEVRKLMAVAAIAYGEPLPPVGCTEELEIVETYIDRLGRDVFKYCSSDLGEWLLNMYSALGDISPEGKYPYKKVRRGLEYCWDAKLRHVYEMITGKSVAILDEVRSPTPITTQLHLDV